MQTVMQMMVMGSVCPLLLLQETSSCMAAVSNPQRVL